MVFLKKWWPFFLPMCILAIAIAFFATTKSQLQYGEEFIERSNIDTSSNIGEIKKGDVVEQHFVTQVDEITKISILFATYNRENKDELTISLEVADTGEILGTYVVPTAELEDNSLYPLPIQTAIQDVAGKKLILKVTSKNGWYGNAVTIYSGENFEKDGALYLNGEELSGNLCMEIMGKVKISYGRDYWLLISALLALLIPLEIFVYQKERRGIKTIPGNVFRGIEKYWFLLCQLVSRDFKTKYKRSVLGMLWSLLNPLLTMTVQYIVFSTFFRFDIQNYPVYLLSGSVFFNYMSDATSQSMVSIVQNASLINKVYVPKYIYPFSKVLSCGVNFLLSLTALYIVIIVTGVNITINHFFLVYGILCTFLFILGVSFFLSALMVYFRDMQFLYGVFLQMWIYLTPLFYPENILPDKVMRIIEFNPMYHFIRFIRIIILNGVLPEFKAWVYCAIFAIVPFIVGYLVFRKLQKRFILYI